MRTVQHWGAWYDLFGFEQRQRCTVRKLKSAYRRLQATYHPDKFEPRSMRHCAEHASVILSAGRELLLVHGACGRRGRWTIEREA